MSNVISKNLRSYLDQIDQHASAEKIEKYFHINHVIDAYNKGEEDGKKNTYENIFDKFTRASTQIFFYGQDVITTLGSNGFNVSDVYVNPFQFKLLLTTNIENTFNEDFISCFYSKTHELETKFRDDFNFCAVFMFMQNENINEDELKADKYFKISS